MQSHRRGVLAGIGAYFLWGLFPLYWRALVPAAPFEILSHRVLWSLALVIGVVVARGGGPWLRQTSVRRLGVFALAGTLLGLNWGAYIWGVNNGHVIETALGYFINPLVNVALGVLVLRERMRPAQWVAVGCAAVAVTFLTVNYGRPPWLALWLAVSFALYGLIKKQAAGPALDSLVVETAALALPALAYLVHLERTGAGTFGHVTTGHDLALASTGPMTVLPLVLFGVAAVRVPLSTLGLLQYLAPSLQFLCGVLVFHEEMPPARWLGFALVWAGLLLFAWDQLEDRRRRPAARGQWAVR